MRLRFYIVHGWWVAALLAILVWAVFFFGHRPEVSATDYAEVAKVFVTKNAFIAAKIGKVTAVNHIGRGGGSGSVSYNVLHITGTEESGLCNLVLSRDENNRWQVKKAELIVNGSYLNVPVSRASGDKWQRFKLW